MHRVHSKEISRKEKIQLWRDIMSDFHKSGQSAREYSEQHGIKLNNLNYHRYSKKSKAEPKVLPSKFLPVSFEKPTTESTLLISYHGIEIKLPLTFDTKMIIELVSGLRGMSC